MRSSFRYGCKVMVRLIVLFISIIMAMAVKSEAYVASVTQINATAAVWDTVNKAMITPSVVTATEGGKVAARTAALSVTPARGAVIIGTLAALGVSIAGDKLIGYLNTKNFGYKAGDPDLQYNDIGLTGAQYTEAVRQMGDLLGCTNDSYRGAFSTSTAAGNAVGGNYSYKYLSGGGVSGIVVSYNRVYDSSCGSGLHTNWAVFPDTSGAIGLQMRDATAEEKNTLQSAITTDLTNGTQAAIDALREQLKVVEAALKGLANALTSNPTALETVKTQLTNSIPSQTTTELTNDLAGETSTQDYLDQTVNIGGSSSTGATREEVQDSVKKALDDETGITEPTESTYTQPTKSNITTILTSFTNAINNLALIQTLKGINLVASGSSVLCLNLPSKYGGSTCWDASAISSELSTAGTGILSVVTMLSFIMIFRG